MSSHTMEKVKQENLQLHVCNTFFHVKDANFEAQKAQFLQRSYSDSSLNSSLSSSKSQTEGEEVSQKAVRSLPAQQGPSGKAPDCLGHKVWKTPESSRGTSEHSSVVSNSNPTDLKGASELEANLENVSVLLGQLPGQNIPQGLVPQSSSSAVEHNPAECPLTNPEQRPCPEQTYETNQFVEVTTVGSVGHDDGACKPCIFWTKHQCSNGYECPFCHLSHKGQKTVRNRPSKKTRESRARHFAENMPEQSPAGRREWIVQL